MLNQLAKLREEREEGEKGFTLIELLVVVVIIGILIAIAIPLYLNYKKGANDKGAQSDLRAAVSTLEQCNSDNGSYPTSVTYNSAGGACAGQRINTSTGTTLNYYPSTAATPSAYIIYGTNTSGGVDGSATGGYYCYSSNTGGAVLKKTAALPTAYAATC